MLSTYLSSNTIIGFIQLLSSSLRNQAGVTALMWAAQGGHVDTVKLLLDSGSDIEDKDNVSTRRCITLYMHAYLKWSMSWMNIVRRALMRWDEMRWLLIDDEDDVWIVCDFNIQHSIFHTYLEISYEIKWRFSLVSLFESYNFVDCNLLFVICISISMNIAWHRYLYKNICS